MNLLIVAVVILCVVALAALYFLMLSGKKDKTVEERVIHKEDQADRPAGKGSYSAAESAKSARPRSSGTKSAEPGSSGTESFGIRSSGAEAAGSSGESGSGKGKEAAVWENGRTDRRSTKKKPVSRPAKTEKEEAAAEIYDCINKSLRIISSSWARDELDQVGELGILSPAAGKYYDEISGELPDNLKFLLAGYKDAASFEEREGAIIVSAGEGADLEQLLYDSMMPFYPLYGRNLQKEGIRYGAMLSKEVLSLFHQLTGRKFRAGFHRRYRSGVDSFDWKDNHYTVRDSKGNILCDADFEEGKVIRGWARMPSDQDGDALWEVYQEGFWEDGSLKDGTICYQYRKSIGETVRDGKVMDERRS